MLRTFIQIMALTLTLLSAYFLIESALNMSVKDMTKLSGSSFGYSLSALESYTKQKANTVTGFALLMASFTLALINLLWPMRFDDFIVNKKGVIIALVLSIIIFFISNYTSKKLSNKWFEQGKEILESYEK